MSSKVVSRVSALRHELPLFNPNPYNHELRGSGGPGGRSSVSGITATVFGAYGFIGRYFLEELGRRGSRVYVPFRGDELEVRHLKTSFDLGQLGLIPFSPRDKDSIRECVRRSDVVINLIGKHYETKHIVPTRRANGKLSRVNYDFEEVNVTIPRTIAEICAKEDNVKTLIHVSALSADLNSKSKWSQTKAQGEIAVREAFPDAIIVKPATIFGAEDRFLNWFAEFSARWPTFRLIDGGSTLVQPVYSHDVAKALMAMIEHHEILEGETIQLAGPAEYSYKEIAEFVADITKQKIEFKSIPSSAAKIVGRVMEEMINPVLTSDMIEQMTENVLPKDEPTWLTMKDLNIEPVSMEKVSFEFLHRFRKGGHFDFVEGYH